MPDEPVQATGDGQEQLAVTSSESSGVNNAPSVRRGASGVSMTPPLVSYYEQHPIKLHRDVSDEKLEMLANLPRKNWDEFTYAALGGAIAALPSAAEAFHSALKRNSIEWFEFVQISILVVFVVCFLVRLTSRGEKRSIDLLKEMRGHESAD